MKPSPALRRFLWFVLLWCVGVAGTALITYPFHYLAVKAMGH
ncbi:hypothetical protein P9250_06200 [Caballeronia sp. LP006]|jgi:hypothetical protein|nr:MULTISPECIES: hypothetical protein [unclassified Caballeronia]MDR5773893.1 hypothetical protein [Caballeronia sp. LZ002]MDR5799339.1 hypothetical protein [Caballeronia sp. LZ001]MDR5827457.1 hypothetical protein [Caballeronia sp. LP006]MDR5849328.1 hypothetical protein [Caballeronia sp. LZ003]